MRRALQRGHRWWVESEVYQAQRTASFTRHLDVQWSNADVIARCAFRYIRLHKIRATVETWNSLCEVIARRSGFTHTATMRSVLLQPGIWRSKSLVKFWAHERCSKQGNECGRPSPVHLAESIRERAARIHAIRAARIRQEREAIAKATERQNRKVQRQINQANDDIRLIKQAINSARAAMKGKR